MDEPIGSPSTSSSPAPAAPHLLTANEERARHNTVRDCEERIRRYQRRMAELHRLGDEIAVLSAQIQAATHRLLVLIAEFDRREGWFAHGARSCAHWLVWRTGLAPGAAREWVRVAREIEVLSAPLGRSAQGRDLLLQGPRADPDRDAGERAAPGRAGAGRHGGARREDRAGVPAVWTAGGAGPGALGARDAVPGGVA